MSCLLDLLQKTYFYDIENTIVGYSDNIMSTFRSFYLIYIIIKYIYKKSINNIKDKLITIIENLSNISSNEFHYVIKNIIKNYDYLYQIFFEDNNIYF